MKWLCTNQTNEISSTVGIQVFLDSGHLRTWRNKETNAMSPLLGICGSNWNQLGDSVGEGAGRYRGGGGWKIAWGRGLGDIVGEGAGR